MQTKEIDMASQHEMREQRSTATEAKKTAAKETIITGKETRTKAETTSGQAIAMRQKKKDKSVSTRRARTIGRRWRPVRMLLPK